MACNCDGFEEHPWKSSCKKCRCTRDCHKVFTDLGARTRIGLIGGQRSHEYKWIPSGLNDKQVLKYFAQLPSEDVPKVGYPGDQRRQQRLIAQLPKQDMAPLGCKNLSLGTVISLQDFIRNRNEDALDVGEAVFTKEEVNCAECNKPIYTTLPAVSSMKLPGKLWHPACFTCSQCHDLLVDLIFCIFENKTYCVKHYGEKCWPRCNACEELIFNARYINALDKNWHEEHFSCWKCEKPITQRRYVLHKGQSYCVSCYERQYTINCEKCEKSISVNSKELVHNDKHWHEDCFQCTACGELLVNKQYGWKNEELFCLPCYHKYFALRCELCGEVFKPGMKKMQYKDRVWHDGCFRCCKCRSVIGPQGFVPCEEGGVLEDIYCIQCFERKYAPNCRKCNSKIRGSTCITFRNEPWHRDCVECAQCKKKLNSRRFTLHRSKPYCVDCYDQQRKTRCTHCGHRIKGNNVKLVSFEGRHWHKHCFNCSNCRSTLVEGGFFLTESGILCIPCGTIKDAE